MYKSFLYYQRVIILLITVISFPISAQADHQQCPALFHQGVIDLPFNPAFTSIKSIDDNKSLFLNEAADLMYHYIVLLTAKGYTLNEMVEVLEERHSK